MIRQRRKDTMETRLIYRQPVLRYPGLDQVDDRLEQALEQWDSSTRSQVIHRILHRVGQVDGLCPSNMHRVTRCGLPEDCFYVLDRGLPSEVKLAHVRAYIIHQDPVDLLEVVFTSDYLGGDAG